MINSLPTENDASVRAEFVSALGLIADERALEPLLDVLKKDIDSNVRRQAAWSLGILGDARAYTPLLETLQKEPDLNIRCQAAVALSNLGNERAADELSGLLGEETTSKLRMHAALGLGNLGNKRAVRTLLKTLPESIFIYHRSIASTLVNIGDRQAVEPLIDIMKTSNNKTARINAAHALGLLGDMRAQEALRIQLDKRWDYDEEQNYAIAFLNLAGSEAVEFLEKARIRKNPGAGMALAWFRGGDDLIKMQEMLVDTVVSLSLDELGLLAKAKWGDLKSIKSCIRELPQVPYFLEPFFVEVLSIMPSGFPPFNCKADYKTRLSQARAIDKWYENHKHRLAWNKEDGKYYLKQEQEKK
jgi:hypothetical protein